SSSDGLFGTQSPFSLKALTDSTGDLAGGTVFAVVVVLMLLRASLPSGYIIGAIGIAIVGSIAIGIIFAIPSSVETRWLKFILGVYLQIPQLIFGMLFMLAAQSLIRRRFADRYLCAELTRHPLHWRSVLSVVGVPLSLLNAGRRIPAALLL